ncbi:MAG: hypothetical protein A2014_04885 [Spirochaetes bacterium GWF1_49_6]|nr:MAG: hypothetical protein A2014_04885 [Spirochaetes bacterium GWF1_49_6]
MARIPLLSGEEIIRILEKFGFKVLRQKGSHVSLKRETLNGSIGCVVPNHKEVAAGTLRGILKQAQITLEDFLK